MPIHDYMFYVIHEDGSEIRWGPMSEIAASRMYRHTRDYAPSNILKFGWGRIPELKMNANKKYAYKKVGVEDEDSE